MPEKVKVILSPGLINLLLLEGLFLLLAVYTGLAIWGGVFTTIISSAINFVAGLLLILWWFIDTAG